MIVGINVQNDGVRGDVCGVLAVQGNLGLLGVYTVNNAVVNQAEVVVNILDGANNAVRQAVFLGDGGVTQNSALLAEGGALLLNLYFLGTVPDGVYNVAVVNLVSILGNVAVVVIGYERVSETVYSNNAVGYAGNAVNLGGECSDTALSISVLGGTISLQALELLAGDYLVISAGRAVISDQNNLGRIVNLSATNGLSSVSIADNSQASGSRRIRYIYYNTIVQCSVIAEVILSGGQVLEAILAALYGVLVNSAFYQLILLNIAGARVVVNVNDLSLAGVVQLQQLNLVALDVRTLGQYNCNVRQGGVLAGGALCVVNNAVYNVGINSVTGT